jgi:hypothetical protein
MLLTLYDRSQALAIDPVLRGVLKILLDDQAEHHIFLVGHKSRSPPTAEKMIQW